MGDNKKFKSVTFAPGDYIFEEGKAGKSAYLILSGEVEIRTNRIGEKSRRIARVGKGEIIGEMSLFDKGLRMATGIATTRVETIRLSRSKFRDDLKALKPVTKSVIKMLVKHFRSSHEQFAGTRKVDWRRK